MKPNGGSIQRLVKHHIDEHLREHGWFFMRYPLATWAIRILPLVAFTLIVGVPRGLPRIALLLTGLAAIIVALAESSTTKDFMRTGTVPDNLLLGISNDKALPLSFKKALAKELRESRTRTVSYSKLKEVAQLADSIAEYEHEAIKKDFIATASTTGEGYRALIGLATIPKARDD